MPTRSPTPSPTEVPTRPPTRTPHRTPPPRTRSPTRVPVVGSRARSDCTIRSDPHVHDFAGYKFDLHAPGIYQVLKMDHIDMQVTVDKCSGVASATICERGCGTTCMTARQGTNMMSIIQELSLFAFRTTSLGAILRWPSRCEEHTTKQSTRCVLK